MRVCAVSYMSLRCLRGRCYISFFSTLISVHNHLLLPSVDNVSKQFGSRSGPTLRCLRGKCLFKHICRFCWLSYSSVFSCRNAIMCSLILANSARMKSELQVHFSFKSSVHFVFVTFLFTIVCMSAFLVIK